MRENPVVETVITDSPIEAAAFVRRGGIVAFPTETVYGLGADVFNEKAISRVFEAKGRPADNPLIVHISELLQIDLLAAEVPKAAWSFIEAFFPGPLTIVLSKTAVVPMVATAGLSTVGVRMPENRLAREFIHHCGTPVVAPSANLSGRPSPTTWQAVEEDLNGRIDCILRGDPTAIGLESTVVDCSADAPVLLRKGAISLARLRKIVPSTVAADDHSPDAAKSPGLRHKHYSPTATVIIVGPADTAEAEAASGYIGIHDRAETFALKRICTDMDEYARELYEFFRACDRRGLKQIYCERPNDEGIGTALLDRIERAAER